MDKIKDLTVKLLAVQGLDAKGLVPGGLDIYLVGQIAMAAGMTTLDLLNQASKMQGTEGYHTFCLAEDGKLGDKRRDGHGPNEGVPFSDIPAAKRFIRDLGIESGCLCEEVPVEKFEEDIDQAFAHYEEAHNKNSLDAMLHRIMGE